MKINIPMKIILYDFEILIVYDVMNGRSSTIFLLLHIKQNKRPTSTNFWGCTKKREKVVKNLQ